MIDWLINPLKCFFSSNDHVALDRNPGLGYNTLHLQLIPGDLLSACPHRQFHTLPALLDSLATLSTLMHVCQAGRQFVPFLWWSLVWPGRDSNPWPTVWEADMLITTLARHGCWLYIAEHHHRTIRLFCIYFFSENRPKSRKMKLKYSERLTDIIRWFCYKVINSGPMRARSHGTF